MLEQSLHYHNFWLFELKSSPTLKNIQQNYRCYTPDTINLGFRRKFNPLMQGVNFADYLERGCAPEKQKNKGIGSIQKDGEKVNAICYTPDISGLIYLKKCISM